MISVLSDGTQIISAKCEMDNDELIRIVIWRIDSAGRPKDAFVKLFKKNRNIGNGLFYFYDDQAKSVIYNEDLGYFQQSINLEKPVDIFGAHPISGDAMKPALYDFSSSKIQTFDGFTTSSLPNGESGPILKKRKYKFEFLRNEKVKVPAGVFDCKYFLWHFDEYPPIHIWNYSKYNVPIRIEWSLLNSRYDLISLN